MIVVQTKELKNINKQNKYQPIEKTEKIEAILFLCIGSILALLGIYLPFLNT